MQHGERLLDLLAFLLEARRPVSVGAIFEAFSEEYGDNSESRERKFSRDKEALRELGVPVEWVPPADEDEPGGYRVDREQLYLPDIALTPSERAALYASGAAAQAGAFPLRTELSYALAKLQAGAKGQEEPTRPQVIATTRRREVEHVIAEAVTERRRLRLVYPPEQQERHVDPYAFAVRRGRFVFVGFCHLRGGIRTFSADRLTRCKPVKPDAKGPEFDLPAHFDVEPHLPRHPWQVRVHAPVEVTLAFAPELAESGPHALGITGATVPATNVDGLLAQVLALGAGVRVVAPDDVRDRLAARLAAMHAAFERGEPLEARS